MTFRVWTPQPPTGDLRDLSDQERRIYYEPGRLCAVWNLAGIQAALVADPPLPIISTPKAQWEMKALLGWGAKDPRLFLKALSRGRYVCSEWCYAPQGSTPHACDVYVMGYSRTKGEENPQLQPWAYVKFGFMGPAFNKIGFFSAHPEGQYKGY